MSCLIDGSLLALTGPIAAVAEAMCRPSGWLVGGSRAVSAIGKARWRARGAAAMWASHLVACRRLTQTKVQRMQVAHALCDLGEAQHGHAIDFFAGLTALLGRILRERGAFCSAASRWGAVVF